MATVGVHVYHSLSVFAAVTCAPLFSVLKHGRTYTLFITCFALFLSAVLGNGSLSILCIFQAVRAEIISGKGEGGMRLELECVKYCGTVFKHLINILLISL